jgi:hypothetical protein
LLVALFAVAEEVARRDSGSDVPVKGVVGAGVVAVKQRGRSKQGLQIWRRSRRCKFKFLGDHGGPSRAMPLTDSESRCFIRLQYDLILS